MKMFHFSFFFHFYLFFSLLFHLPCVKLFSLHVSPIVPSLKGVPHRIKDLVSIDKIVSIRVRHIQVETEAVAKECYSMLLSGVTDFDTLAKSISSCTNSRQKGGDLGWFHENDNFRSNQHDSLPFEIVKKALSLSKGEMSVHPISEESPRKQESESSVSWHIIQLMDVINKLSPTFLKKRGGIPTEGTHFPGDFSSLSYFVETLGCQMNQADSERIAGQLSSLGYKQAKSKEEANTIVVNTCSIRDHAEQKVYSYLGLHAQRKRKGENVQIVVAGCKSWWICVFSFLIYFSRLRSFFSFPL
jgi:hypothetical protein